MRSRTVAVAFFVACATMLAASRSKGATAASFSIRLENTQYGGWKGYCDSGCSWTEITTSCKNDCTVSVDDSGVSREGGQPNVAPAFRFTVHRVANGGSAVGVTGTVWKNLGWSCALSVCRVRITESGVEQLD